MKRILAILLCIFLISGAFSGCNVEEEPYVPTGDGLTWDEETEPTGSAVTQQSMSLPYYPERSMNPYSCSDYTNKMLLDLVYQGLFIVDADYNPRPVLCKSYSISWDMKTYTFYLAEATFSDGTPLTAQDVAASLKEAVKSPVYSGRFGYVEHIDTTDDGAVTVELETPYENFPILLDVPIVKKSGVSEKRPLGTGPYAYESDENSLSLRRRTDWWCVAALPVTAERITLVAGESPAQLRDEFEFNDLSVVCADPGSDAYVDFHSDYELWDSENGIFLYLACNRYSSVFGEDAVRQALTYAIDREALADTYYRGFANTTWLPTPQKSPYYSGALAAQYSYNPERLKQAVAEAELTNHTVKLLVNKDDSIRLRAARAIAESLSQCGLKVTTSELNTDAYLEALEEGSFDLYLGQTRLSANMDLSAFFAEEGALSYGYMSDASTYALCMDALANRGNYFTLYTRILADGQLCPILFRTYAIFTQRGTFTELNPARDHIFYYDLGKTLDEILISE